MLRMPTSEVASAGLLWRAGQIRGDVLPLLGNILLQIGKENQKIVQKLAVMLTQVGHCLVKLGHSFASMPDAHGQFFQSQSDAFDRRISHKPVLPAHAGHGFLHRRRQDVLELPQYFVHPLRENTERFRRKARPIRRQEVVVEDVNQNRRVMMPPFGQAVDASLHDEMRVRETVDRAMQQQPKANALRQVLHFLNLPADKVSHQVANDGFRIVAGQEGMCQVVQNASACAV